jgi:putative flavoprotein involved in K+ transport
MINEQIETLIIGGGQAGLAMSYHLNRLGREHIVLERQRIAERWRSQRWDSLTFQSPNWNIQLPGFALGSGNPGAFASRDEIIRFIESYAAVIRAPLRCGVAVTNLRQEPGSMRLIIETPTGLIEAKNVVIATGPYQVPVRPLPIARGVLHVHSSHYRNPQSLPPGAILVIGTGNSGCQIAEELCHEGRRVYLSVSKHRRAPRRYRGKDYVWWQRELDEVDQTVEQRQAEQPARLITGVSGGHDVDLRRLAMDGVVLLGRVLEGEDHRLVIAEDLRENLARGDASFAAFTRHADAHPASNRFDLPRSDERQEVVADPKEVVEPILSIDVTLSGISTIIWANGFRYNFDWINLPIFAGGGNASSRVPVHKRGITTVPGVYFLGLPWLHKYKSALLHGVGEDAEHLAKHIAGFAPKIANGRASISTNAGALENGH